jgi:putative methionine-R-sulfoxide reductase with GAF domain
VLDLDSRDVGAFDETDEQGLYQVLRAAKLI